MANKTYFHIFYTLLTEFALT